MRVSSNVENFDFPHKYFTGTSAYLWRNKKARIKQFGVWSVEIHLLIFIYLMRHL